MTYQRCIKKSRRLDWNLILWIHINVNSSFLFEEIFRNVFNSQSQYWKASVAKARFFGLRCLANSINERCEVDNGLSSPPTDLSVCLFFHCHPRIPLLNTTKFSMIPVTLSWGTLCCTHIPTKSCAPFHPALIFLLDIATRKNQHWGGRKCHCCPN